MHAVVNMQTVTAAWKLLLGHNVYRMTFRKPILYSDKQYWERENLNFWGTKTQLLPIFFIF
jgi:hypothetical protein